MGVVDSSAIISNGLIASSLSCLAVLKMYCFIQNYTLTLDLNIEPDVSCWLYEASYNNLIYYHKDPAEIHECHPC